MCNKSLCLCAGNKDIYFQHYGRYNIKKIWRDDILPCRVYLRHWYVLTHFLCCSPTSYKILFSLKCISIWRYDLLRIFQIFESQGKKKEYTRGVHLYIQHYHSSWINIGIKHVMNAETHCLLDLKLFVSHLKYDFISVSLCGLILCSNRAEPKY